MSYLHGGHEAGGEGHDVHDEHHFEPQEAKFQKKTSKKFLKQSKKFENLHINSESFVKPADASYLKNFGQTFKVSRTSYIGIANQSYLHRSSERFFSIAGASHFLDEDREHHLDEDTEHHVEEDSVHHVEEDADHHLEETDGESESDDEFAHHVNWARVLPPMVVKRANKNGRSEYYDTLKKITYSSRPKILERGFAYELTEEELFLAAKRYGNPVKTKDHEYHRSELIPIVLEALRSWKVAKEEELTKASSRLVEGDYSKKDKVSTFRSGGTAEDRQKKRAAELKKRQDEDERRRAQERLQREQAFRNQVSRQKSAQEEVRERLLDERKELFDEGQREQKEREYHSVKQKYEHTIRQLLLSKETGVWEENFAKEYKKFERQKFDPSVLRASNIREILTQPPFSNEVMLVSKRGSGKTRFILEKYWVIMSQRGYDHDKLIDKMEQKTTMQEVLREVDHELATRHAANQTADTLKITESNYLQEDLPSGWEAKRTKDGRVFYLNHNDKTTSWEHPRTVLAKKQAQEEKLSEVLPSGWEARMDTKKNRVYYIDHNTKTTTYQHPTEYIREQEEQMRRQKEEAERKRIAAEKKRKRTEGLEKINNLFLLKPSGIPRDDFESAYYDMIGDRFQPEDIGCSTVDEALQDRAIKKNIVSVSGYGKVIYIRKENYNRVKTLGNDDDVARALSSSATLEEAIQSLQFAKREQQQRPQITGAGGGGGLPPGWEAKRDPRSGKVFFLNHRTKQTTWDDPRPLPAGWRAGKSGGRTFYINDATKSTSWDDPRPPLRI